MWQKCPICNGTGRVPEDGFTSAVYQTCTVCCGFKIINDITGLPPVTQNTFKKLDNIELKNLKNPE